MVGVIFNLVPTSCYPACYHYNLSVVAEEVRIEVNHQKILVAFDGNSRYVIFAVTFCRADEDLPGPTGTGAR
jgi:hypothetical protein